MNRIRKEDQVIVLAGKDKGRVGDVVRFVGNERVIVSTVNMVQRHTRATQPGARQGIIAQEAPLHLSNVAIYNPNTEKADKVGIRQEDGDKIRFYRSTGERIDD